MSGLIWAGITQNHAQDVDDQRRGRHIYGRHWRRMAADAGLAALAIVRRVVRMCEKIRVALPAAVEETAAMPTGRMLLDPFATAIGQRAALVGDNALRDDLELEAPDDGVAFDRETPR